jgi:hypothetical protein
VSSTGHPVFEVSSVVACGGMDLPESDIGEGENEETPSSKYPANTASGECGLTVSQTEAHPVFEVSFSRY